MKEISFHWKSWFAGFTAGDGCFGIVKYNLDNPRINYGCQFTIALRADDRGILEEIHETLELGKIFDRPAYPSGGRNNQAQTAFKVQSIADCAELVTLFEKYPLRAKKGRDFIIWKQAVAELQKPIDERNTDLLDYYFLKIREVRKYDEPDELPRPTIRVEQLVIEFI